MHGSLDRKKNCTQSTYILKLNAQATKKKSHKKKEKKENIELKRIKHKNRNKIEEKKSTLYEIYIIYVLKIYHNHESGVP